MSTQAQEREYPAPAINVESKRFWDATKEGKLLIGLCKDTGKHFFYPRSTSPFTLSKNVEWVEASGRGTIYSFSVMRRAPIPYAIAYVTLDEGPTMMTNIVECDLDALKIGQKVELVFRPAGDDAALPVFRPVG